MVEENNEFGYSNCKKIKEISTYFSIWTITITNSPTKFELDLRYRNWRSNDNLSMYFWCYETLCTQAMLVKTIANTNCNTLAKS